MSWISDIYVTVAMVFIKLMVYAYEYLTLPIYYMFSKTEYFMPFPEDEQTYFKKFAAEESRTLSLPVVQGDPGSPWRAVEYIDNLATVALPGCPTLADLWLRTIKLWPNKPALGTREVLQTDYEVIISSTFFIGPNIKTVLPNGKKMVKLTMGEYIWETYIEAESRVSALAAGLRNLLGPLDSNRKSGEDFPTPLVLFSETRAEWLYAAEACWRLNRPVATLYASLGDDAIVHGLEQTEAFVVFTSDELLSKVVNLLPRCPLVKYVIFFSNGVIQKHSGRAIEDQGRLNETARLSVEAARKALPEGVRLYDILELEEQGRVVIREELATDEEPLINWQPPVEERPKPNDLAVIMYTSGSTGAPKGVEMVHDNIICAIAGLFRRMPKLNPESDIYIGYLPLAHVLELTCELCALIMSIPIGFSNPQTLTGTSTRIKKGACQGDINVLKPTLFATVPIVLDRIAKAVWEKVKEGGPLMEAIFHFAYDYKCRRLHTGFPSFLVNLLIFRKVRALVGGRLRLLVSGGAPLSEESHLFTNVCFAPIMQGYGLTETCAAATLMECGDLRGHHVGAPIPSVQIRLRAWKEGGYSPYDKPFPRGEILIAGGSVTRGYYKNSEATADAFFTDKNGLRWFCTGDIGMIHQDGSFSIIDRKKDLVKLQGGEYVSLVKVELALGQSVYVENICVYADPRENYTICFIYPKLTQVRKLGDELGLLDAAAEAANASLPLDKSDEPTSRSLAEHAFLCRHPQVIERVTEDIRRVGAAKRLTSFEIPRKVLLDPEPWTPESGLVTDALKIKRFNIKRKFEEDIKRMYAE
ncbi:Long-chain-fatty-acid--CoA ligase 4 [Taenia solium]|eukprot:TsM_000719800 transcript=TsM_000719800 gene=TsM_000719800